MRFLVVLNIWCELCLLLFKIAVWMISMLSAINSSVKFRKEGNLVGGILMPNFSFLTLRDTLIEQGNPQKLYRQWLVAISPFQFNVEFSKNSLIVLQLPFIFLTSFFLTNFGESDIFTLYSFVTLFHIIAKKLKKKL